MVDLKGSKIIESEFGNIPIGRGTMDKMNWWPQLLERVNGLCESAYRHGKEDGMNEAERKALGPDQVIILKEGLDELKRKADLYDQYQNPGEVNINYTISNGNRCARAVICKFFEAEE